MSFTPTCFYTCRTAWHDSSPRQTTRCPRSCQSSRSAPVVLRQSSAPAGWSSTLLVVTCSATMFVGRHLCGTVWVMRHCILTLPFVALVSGHPRPHRCSGPSVPWVSLPGPTGVLPMPRQDGIGSRAPTTGVALCRWWTCHVDVAHAHILQAYLLSLLSNHVVLQSFHWHRRAPRLCCKRRHWNCALILSVFICVTSLRPSCFRDCFTVSLHVVRLNSLRVISGLIKRRKLISKNVFLQSRLIPCVKRQSFVAAEQGTRTRNHRRLTGNVRQPSTIIRFHILKISRITHRIHLFLHLLQLGSEL